MKITYSLLLSFVACLPCHGAEKLDVLRLKDGREYTKVEITGVSAKGVRILHNSGAANVPVDQLPDVLQKKYAAAQAKAAEAETASSQKKAETMPPATSEPKSAPAPAKPAKPAKPAPAPSPDAAPLPQIVTGKTYGLAEVMADVYNLDGKIVKVEVIPNGASRIENVGKGLYQIFVGDPSAKADSDYVYMSFPEEGRGKVETMLKGRRGKMTFYMEVRANSNPKIHAVGRSTSSGSPGTPIKIIW